MRDLIEGYIYEIEKTYKFGAREEGFYPHLKKLIEDINPDIEVIQSPGREDFGFPDFKVIDRKTLRVIGYIEAKKPGENLDRAETSEQLKRYFAFIPNLILTDFVEFRLYRDGKLLDKNSIAVNNLYSLERLSPKPDFQKFLSIISTFLAYSLPAINSMDDLAQKLAIRTRILKGSILNNFDNALIKDIYEIIKDGLIRNLKKEYFSDILAQTITYSLLVGKMNAPVNKPLNINNISQYIPANLKVIKAVLALFVSGQMMITPPDGVKWAIEDILTVINAYGGKISDTNFIQYFYEPFLREYDPQLRELRGVYYTPYEVINFIVRAVDKILEDMDYGGGLINESVKILDPCAGTGAFISKSINLAVEKFKNIWGDAAVESFIDKHILENFYAFELLVAPYVIAHLMIKSQIEGLGYKGNKPLKLYLTNTLEEPQIKYKIKSASALAHKYLLDERKKADDVKNNVEILAIIGNPPYSAISANKNKWIESLLKGDRDLPTGELLQSFYKVNGKEIGERKILLGDDYVKFIRFAQWKIANNGKGIVAFITNHSYLDNPTFRGMRQSLLKSFDKIYIINLHGNTRKKEGDENIFAIQQGVAIGIFIKKGINPEKYADVYYFSTLENGLVKASEKLEFLLNNDLKTIPWKKLNPKEPLYLFVPTSITNELEEEYNKGWKITEIFKEYVSGLQTSRDKLVIDFEKNALIRKIKIFTDQNLTDDDVKRIFKLSENYQWKLSEARKKVIDDLQNHNIQEFVIPILYRPFDIRYLFYHPALVHRTRIEVMIHMLRGWNVGMVAQRQTNLMPYRSIFISGKIIDFGEFGEYSVGPAYLFPLYLYLPDTQTELKHKGDEKVEFPIMVKSIKYKRIPNFTKEFEGFIHKKYGDKVLPEEAFYYIYAVLYSPKFRKKYEEFLKYDFPKIPFPDDYDTFKAFADIGKELAELHLLNFQLTTPTVKFLGQGDGIINKVKYDKNKRRIYINNMQYIEPVDFVIWDYYIGGYRVLDKWLKVRKGRRLDFETFAKIVYTLEKTIELQNTLAGFKFP